jgi:hypothetical protein
MTSFLYSSVPYTCMDFYVGYFCDLSFCHALTIMIEI